MTERQAKLIDAMYAALKNLGCRCEHNVPYAGSAEPQFVTRQCARCRCIDEYLAIKSEAPA